MDRNNRPQSRKENITGGNGHVGKTGSGLGRGPSSNARQNTRPASSGPRPSRPEGEPTRRSGKKGGLSVGTIILVLVLYFVVTNLFGGDDTGATQESPVMSTYQEPAPGPATGHSSSHTTYSDASDDSADMTVSTDAREKFTTLLGNGRDTVTLMMYLCGTDLESKYGMATSDLVEMTKADLSENVNIIVCTGGCNKWNNSFVSNSVNQIYRVKKGGMEMLVENFSNGSMTNEQNLANFIQWSAKNYPASRYDLILWDHGGGTLSGYGYDEKYASSSSMSIDRVAKGLAQGGVKFDFVGFDACLMATLETALAVEPYADYLIASEETEPGYGWYYTGWLSTLSQNTSTDTITIGKEICDSFISDNAKKSNSNSGMTLSVTDLAELSGTAPEVFMAFSDSISNAVASGNYQMIADARKRAKEYATSQRIDQIDLLSFCDDINTSESNALSSVLAKCVKYNHTSPDMRGSQGLSIYFPWRKNAYINTVLNTYNNIGIDSISRYGKAVRQFGSLQLGGQVSSGGSSDIWGQLFGDSSSSGSSYGSSNGSSDIFFDIFGSLLSGQRVAPGKSINGLTADNSDWLDVDFIEDHADYILDNSIDTTQLVWTNVKGQKLLILPEDQWDLVEDIELSLLYDDGFGYIDLGLDNLFTFDDEGNLIGDWDGTWIALNGQIAPYFMLSSESYDDGYVIKGKIPALLNGEEVDILVSFTSENEDGVVLGARKCYDADTTLTVSKGLIPIEDGDEIQFICDYYNYNGTFEDGYQMDTTITVDGDLTISNVYLDDPENVVATYRISDIFNNHYWMPNLND